MVSASHHLAPDFDVAIAGGGPAGLAVAIAARMRNLSAVVLERRASAPDKACGEGLMPPAVRALEHLGVRDIIDREHASPIAGVRFIQPDGTIAEGSLPTPGGLGVRRIALTAAMDRRARDLGTEIRDGVSVQGFSVDRDGVTVATDSQPLRARFLVAADGLNSRLRAMAGLEATTAGPRRFGMRQHFRISPWSRFVEVHLSDGMEAYVTPVGPGRVGIAFLWEEGRLENDCATIGNFLNRFPAIARRLSGASADSRPRGAGPMNRGVRARTAHRFALVGDAAGYVDAITGEGLSLALTSALKLAEVLPEALERGASRERLAAYENDYARRFRRYALITRTLLGVVRRPPVRRSVFAALERHPRVFDAILKFAVA